MTRHIGIVLFPNVDDLDCYGPERSAKYVRQVFRGKWRVIFISQNGGAVKTFP